MSHNDGILAQPPQPGMFWICPQCNAWCALQQVSQRPDDFHGSITTYRCMKCHEEITFAERHPPEAV